MKRILIAVLMAVGMLVSATGCGTFRDLVGGGLTLSGDVPQAGDLIYAREPVDATDVVGYKAEVVWWHPVDVTKPYAEYNSTRMEVKGGHLSGMVAIKKGSEMDGWCYGMGKGNALVAVDDKQINIKNREKYSVPELSGDVIKAGDVVVIARMANTEPVLGIEGAVVHYYNRGTSSAKAMTVKGDIRGIGLSLEAEGEYMMVKTGELTILLETMESEGDK